MSTQMNSVLRLPESLTPEIQEISIAPVVAVPTDHPAGLIMADYLASMGLKVTLIHPFETVGAILETLNEEFVIDSAVEERFLALIARVEENKNISVLNNTRVSGGKGWWGDFSLLVDGEKEEALKASGIAFAYRKQAVVKKPFENDAIIGFREFSALLLKGKESITPTGKALQKLAFVLDLGKRDEKWASMTAIKLGTYLKKAFGVQVSILCRELKVSSDGMEKAYREAREAGVIIYKYLDEPQFEGGASLSINFRDTSFMSDDNPLDVSLEGLDLVVLQESFVTAEDEKALLDGLHIGLEGAYVAPNNPQFAGRTSRKGVVAAGNSRLPETLADMETTALAAAEELYQWTGNGTYGIDVQRVAEVDPSKCATCLTCYRICPHHSIRIEPYGERNVYITKGEKEGATWEAARVLVETCDGCGLCVSECPAKAIQLIYYPDMDVYGFLKENL